MNIIEILNQKIEELKVAISETDLDEKKQLESQLDIIKKCEDVIVDEKQFSLFELSDIIGLIESYDYNIEDLTQILSDIQSVYMVREELHLSSDDVPLDENQLVTFEIFKKALQELKVTINSKIDGMSNKDIDRRIIENLEALKNIFEGNGKRKYYTDEMFIDFCEAFDIFNLPSEEAQELLSIFAQTKNFSTRQTKKIEDIDVNETLASVIELFKEYLPSEKIVRFTHMLEDYKNTVATSIDLDNAREILDFYKENEILSDFDLPALLRIATYARADYVKNEAYPEVMALPEEKRKIYFMKDYACAWIKEKGVSYRTGSFGKTRSKGSGDKEKDLKSSSFKVNMDEIESNIKLLEVNRDLFSDEFDLDDPGAYTNIKTMSPWALKKNIELCKLFKLNAISPIPPTCIENGDIEDKINLAIELGILNPPLSKPFLTMERDINRSEVFQKNASKKGIFNQSIRNYIPRYLSRLSAFSVNDYGYLFYLLKNEGYLGFYNDIFSDSHAGKSRIGEILEGVKNIQFSTPEEFKNFISNNFITEWYSNYIYNFDEYNDVIEEHNNEEKVIGHSEERYIDDSIFDDPLIRSLEENNGVNDTIKQNDDIVSIKNEFVYMFGDRIISRYKVLHNASILKNAYGYLTKEMLLSSVVRNSFLDEETFQSIKSSIMERGLEL